MSRAQFRGCSRRSGPLYGGELIHHAMESDAPRLHYDIGYDVDLLLDGFTRLGESVLRNAADGFVAFTSTQPSCLSQVRAER